MAQFANAEAYMASGRVKQILTVLAESYPDARIALNYASSWELLVAVILSAQCTDKMVNRVTESLFRKYPSLDDYVNADPLEFEQDIKSTGFYRNKSRNILRSARTIRDAYGGQVPDTMEQLTTLPGVARKTANIILGLVYKSVVGIAVDTHVLRISQRLRLVPPEIAGGRHPVIVPDGSGRTDYMKDADPGKVETRLMAVLPQTEWIAFNFRIIDHGRQVCQARKPDCARCPLATLCPVRRELNRQGA